LIAVRLSSDDAAGGATMSRTFLVLTLSVLTASATLAKDLCIQVDTGGYAGSQIVVKKAKLGARNVGPAGGYMARFDANTLTFDQFQPMAGQSVVDTNGDLALGMMLYDSSVSPNGSGIGTTSQAVSCLCNGGADRKINILDFCSVVIGPSIANGHIVDCTDVVAIP
jgi:hypothetical protein